MATQWNCRDSHLMSVETWTSWLVSNTWDTFQNRYSNFLLDWRSTNSVSSTQMDILMGSSVDLMRYFIKLTSTVTSINYSRILSKLIKFKINRLHSNQLLPTFTQSRTLVVKSTSDASNLHHATPARSTIRRKR